MLFVKLFLIATFISIFIQDYKDRHVFWFLYPFIGILGCIVQLEFQDYKVIAMNSLVNLLFVAMLLLINYCYARLMLKKKELTETIGLGDILLFIFLCFCFAFISFFILFTFSLLFSLLLNQFLRRNYKMHATVPLAGYMSVFYSFVYFASLFFNCNYLFAL